MPGLSCHRDHTRHTFTPWHMFLLPYFHPFVTLMPWAVTLSASVLFLEHCLVGLYVRHSYIFSVMTAVVQTVVFTSRNAAFKLCRSLFIHISMFTVLARFFLREVVSFASASECSRQRLSCHPWWTRQQSQRISRNYWSYLILAILVKPCDFSCVLNSSAWSPVLFDFSACFCHDSFFFLPYLVVSFWMLMDLKAVFKHWV